MRVIILQGLPASGKTTWAKAYCEKNPDWVRVNRDDLRNMRGRYWMPKQEEMITAWVYSCIRVGLIGHNVIVDSTNLNPEYLKKLKEIIRGYYPGISIETKKFDANVETCIKRDLKRANSVGEKVIRTMYNKYMAPQVRQYKPDTNRNKAFIFDIDGTLAKMNGRSPYDYSKVGTDLVHKDVENISFILSGPYADNHTILLSGRDSECRKETEQWLKDNNIYYDELHMRPEGNTEKDTVIKERIFFDKIAPRYNVLGVFDDRNSVVDMWRSIGVRCYQVAEGDF